MDDPTRGDSRCVAHEPCPKCLSTDNLARYDDGHAHCFSQGCGYWEPKTDEVRAALKPRSTALIPYEVPHGGLASRRLSEETLRKFGYGVGTFGKDEDPCHVASVWNVAGDQEVAQKLRFEGKKFLTLGDISDAGLFGQRLWREGGKRIVITEGEIDAMSVCQAMGLKWAAVSLVGGASAAAREIKRNLSFLNSHEAVVLMFDNDEPGRAAAAECAPLLQPGKCFIATLPMKDASDMLKAGLGRDLVNAAWEARPYRPGGIVTLRDIRTKVMTPRTMGMPYFLDSVTRDTYGRNYGECVAWGAGVGCGKTDMLLQQIAFDVQQGHKVGLFLLEQPPDETGQRLAGKSVGKLFHIPGEFVPAELEKAYDTLMNTERVFLHDHFGSQEWAEIMRRMRWLYHNEDVRFFTVDHLTALVAKASDERRCLDGIMADVGGLVQEMPIHIDFVSHLTTPDGKSHEEGGRVTASQFTGSRAIMRWAHFMFGIERNTQADDELERRTATLRCIKDRATGRANGKTWSMEYGYADGLLKESAYKPPPPYKDETDGHKSTSF